MCLAIYAMLTNCCILRVHVKESEIVTFRLDIYSLGVTLPYQLDSIEVL